MNHQHGSGMSVETSRSIDLAVVNSPEDLQPCVNTLHRRATFVQAFELFGRPWNRRETPQVEVLLDAHRQPVFAFAIAHRSAGAVPTFMARGAAIFQGATLRFVSNVRHGMTHRCLTDAIITVDRAGL